MFRQMLDRLRREQGAMITGIYTQEQADRMRDYVRIAEARLGKPLSATWTGTLEPTDEYDDKGRRISRHGIQVMVEVVR
jgi:hypothetical protein